MMIDGSHVAFGPSGLNSIPYSRMNGEPIATHFQNGHTKGVSGTNKIQETQGTKLPVYTSIIWTEYVDNWNVSLNSDKGINLDSLLVKYAFSIGVVLLLVRYSEALLYKTRGLINPIWQFGKTLKFTNIPHGGYNSTIIGSLLRSLHQSLKW